MDGRKTQPQYDPQKRSKATVSAVLRSIVAFYLAYLGWTVAQSAGGPDTSMEKWMGWAICVLFMAVAIVFGVYALKRYQADLKAAELPKQDERKAADEGLPPGQDD